jgi:hypothetical protein
MFEDCRTPSLLNSHETAILDSGCRGRFLLVNAPCLKNQISESVDCPPPKRRHHGVNPYSIIGHPSIKQSCFHCKKIPGMANHSFLSFGKLCNEGYSVTFRIDAVTIYKSQNVQILKGARDLDTGLWRINLRKLYQQQHEVANKFYELRNKGALINCLHKAMFSPTKSAILQAVINGHLITWPGLTEQAINTHLKLTPATAMGHMNQHHQNTRSTC